MLRVRGERVVAGNKWRRLQEDFRVPEGCIMRGIQARFEGGVLRITMPRKKKQVQDGSKPAPKVSQDIPSEGNTQQGLPSKARPNPDQSPPIWQPTPLQSTTDTRVLDDQKVIKDDAKIITGLPSVKNQDEAKKSTPDLTAIRQPTPLKAPPEKRADQTVLEDHKVIKDYQKVFGDSPSGKHQVEEKGPTPDQSVQTRQPTPLRASVQKRPNDQSVFEDQRVIKDHQKMFSDLPSGKRLDEPTPDHKQTRQPTSLKAAAEKWADQKASDDHKAIKDDQKIPAESREGKHPDEPKGGRSEAKAKPFEKAGTSKEANDDHKIAQKEKDSSIKMEKRKPKRGGEKLSTATAAPASSGIDDELQNYRQRVKSLLDLNEERQLLVNAGVAILVLVALGIQISHTFGSEEAAP